MNLFNACWFQGDGKTLIQTFSSGIRGGESQREPANSGSAGKWPLKKEGGGLVLVDSLRRDHQGSHQQQISIGFPYTAVGAVVQRV